MDTFRIRNLFPSDSDIFSAGYCPVGDFLSLQLDYNTKLYNCFNIAQKNIDTYGVRQSSVGSEIIKEMTDSDIEIINIIKSSYPYYFTVYVNDLDIDALAEFKISVNARLNSAYSTPNICIHPLFQDVRYGHNGNYFFIGFKNPQEMIHYKHNFYSMIVPRANGWTQHENKTYNSSNFIVIGDSLRDYIVAYGIDPLLLYTDHVIFFNKGHYNPVEYYDWCCKNLASGVFFNGNLKQLKSHIIFQDAGEMNYFKTAWSWF